MGSRRAHSTRRLTALTLKRSSRRAARPASGRKQPAAAPTARVRRRRSRIRHAKPSHRRKSHRRTSADDLHAILGRFADALAWVAVVQVAIEASDQLPREDSVLKRGVAALDAVYNELDLAIVRLKS
jgi:hypothetical protein